MRRFTAATMSVWRLSPVRSRWYGTASQYSHFMVGAPGTESYRVYLEKNGDVISPFHDIPLFANPEKTVLNMIVEIPRWTNAKIEIATGEEFNPLKHDIKKGKIRFVPNCFPYKGYLWNYGALPQTWEDPTHMNQETGAVGDNDPIDVCEIGEQVGQTGQVKQVKVLGVMALLDQGETDWKVIAIDTKDPLADKVNDLEDVKEHFPGLIEATHRWFSIYKVPDGKPVNEFAFGGECKDKAYASSIIEETHSAWKDLIQGKNPSLAEDHQLSVTNSNVNDSPYTRSSASLQSRLQRGTHAQGTETVIQVDTKWYYINK